jgi:hypothetical protein
MHVSYFSVPMLCFRAVSSLIFVLVMDVARTIYLNVLLTGDTAVHAGDLETTVQAR